MENEAVVEAPVDRNLFTKRYTERALAYIQENADRPFFLYLAHAMPGSERIPFASEAFRGTSRNGAWASLKSWPAPCTREASARPCPGCATMRDRPAA